MKNEEEQKLFIDGHENAIIGYGNQYTRPELVIYSLSKIIENLTDEGMTYEDAIEFAEFNILCAWLGEGTPIICDDRERE